MIELEYKYLDDIPELYAEYTHHNLPRYQFTARCVRTGAVFMAYGQEKSVTNTALFLLHLHKHLTRFGLSLAESVIQTDNGTEFTAPWNSNKVTMFTHVAYYQAQFNCQRYNHYKRGTPLELVRETYPELQPEALFMKPVILDNLLVQYKTELAQLVA